MSFLSWLQGKQTLRAETVLEARLLELSPFEDAWACMEAMKEAAQALAAQRAEIRALTRSLRSAHELNSVLQSGVCS